MTVTHIAWGQEKIAQAELLELNQLHDSYPEAAPTRFRDFLASPYFNKDERLADLYRRIRQADQQGRPQLKGKVVLDQWNQGRRQLLTPDYLPRCVSRLNALFLDFLAFEHLHSREDEKWRILQSRLRNQALPDHLKLATRKLRQATAKLPKGFLQLEEDFRLFYDDYYELETDREQKGMALLTALEVRLNQLFAAYEAKLACERVHLENFARQKPMAPPAVEPPINLAELYRLNLALLQADEEDDDFTQAYEAFSKAFLAQADELEATERYILCKYTINALSRAFKNGRRNLKTELFAWMKHRLEWTPGFIKLEGVNDYLNTINVACLCGDLEFAQNYLERYRQRLPEPYAEKTYYLGLADYLFRNQEHLRILDLLEAHFPQHTDSHYFFMLRTKPLRLKACVELLFAEGQPVSVQTRVEDTYQQAYDDLRRYLDRRKDILPEEFYLTHLAFLSSVHDIVLLKRKPLRRAEHKAARIRLQRDIRDKNQLIAKTWLLDLVDRLFP